MSKLLDVLSRLVTARPWFTILVLLVLTVALGYGAVYRAPPPETAETLPKGSAVAEALDEIDRLFSDSGEARVTTILFRGDAITPEGLAQMDALLAKVAAEPGVAELLTATDPLIGPSLLYKALLQAPDFNSVSQAQIDSAPIPPQFQLALDALTGNDVDGSPVSVATVRLRETGDDRIDHAERTIHDLSLASEGTLEASTISFIVVEDEYVKATAEGMGPLIGLAFLLIAALLILFMRTISDLLLTLGGLLMAVIWIVGAEGWLGPNALALIGPPNSLTTMVPIIMIGLTVDYAIQIVSHYREQRSTGEQVAGAARLGWRIVVVPLLLAAVTTIVSLLASLFSPIEIVNDFGVIGGLGVGMSLIVMLTLVPAGRVIIDRRREARGTLRPARPLSTALPGVERLAQTLGRSVTRNPAPYIIVVLAVTAVLGYASRGLEAEFHIRDILPRHGDVFRDMATLDAAVGGSTEFASVLLKAEATETRTLLNLQDLTRAFEVERLRPAAVSGPIVVSYHLLIEDWIHDSGAPGDKYDPELAALFAEASAGVRLNPVGMQGFLDRLGERDPSLGHLLINDPNGIDTMLLQFPVYTNSPAKTKVLQEEVEELWDGHDGAITVTSNTVVSVEVTDSITENQTEAISSTVAVALTVLAVFFWVTVRQPALALIAVGPIVLVLIWVLGTMALLGIPYTIITSIITALSIGIGVDYTIHIIHRYREEYAQVRDPERAAIRTLGTTGSALLGSAMTTALGLGVLVLSPLAASAQFGITAGITIAYALVVSILVVPPAMTVWGAYQNMRLRSNLMRWADELDTAIDAVHRRYEEEPGSS
ncbi:MAG: MMPL family transporter [Chloroflexota bacterium]|nr:MMPL family transporter [Chloroflexota bacterium]